MATMTVVVVNEPGGLENIRIEDRDIPQPGPGQILVKVGYCGCNWADTQMREGIYPHKTDYPLILGLEIAGEVIDVGPNVNHPKRGQRVTTLVEGGGYAQFCVADAGLATIVPEGLSLASAAAYPVQGLTAYHMLYTVSRISAGDWVLVHASGGGVGLFVTQLAIRAGAKVIGTVGTPGKEKKPLAYGATSVINLKDGNFVEQVLDLTEGKGVDLAELVSQLIETLQRIYRDKALNINWQLAEKVRFDGDREDLLELLGNLLDNACKWCHQALALNISMVDDRLCLVVEDDGPGCDDDILSSLSQRGFRADESKPGSGLGLAIVQDIVESYSGSLSFQRSEQWGGLQVTVHLQT